MTALFAGVSLSIVPDNFKSLDVIPAKEGSRLKILILKIFIISFFFQGKTFKSFKVLDLFRGKALLRESISPLSPRGLTTGSIKTIKNTNNFSIFNWIPRSSHGVTEVKLIHATMPRGNDSSTSNCLIKSVII